MTIHWIKCSERIPPDDEHIILHNIDTGTYLSVNKSCVVSDRLMQIFTCEWIPYDEATWNLLNNVIANYGKTQVRLDHNGVPTVYQVQVDMNELKTKSGDKS